MKSFIAALVFLLCLYGNAQSVSTVTYTPTAVVINNPERGFYRHLETQSTNYSVLNQDTLNSYKAKNITLILRMFYLKDFINAPISNAYLTNMQNDFNKIRNAGLKCIVRFAYTNSTKGTTDATKTRILAHIAQLKPLLISNADIIAAVHAGFIGTWGEWYYTTNFGMNPTPTDFQNRKEVLDGLLAALPSSRMVQLRTPALKQKTFGITTALTQNEAFSGTNIARTGQHNDGFLADSTDEGTYVNPATEYPYLEQETKYTPMGGETDGVNPPRSECPSALAEMARFHWSYLNLDYQPNVIAGFKAGGCFVDMQNKLGYRFELTSSEFPLSVSNGSTMTVKFSAKNTGFAAPFNQRTAYLVLRNTSTNQEYTVPLKADPRFWASNTEQAILESVTLPNMISGSYKLFLNLPDTDSRLKPRPEYSIRMANESTWESNTGYNNLLQTITISQNLNDKTPPATPVLADLKGECSVTATAPTTTDDYAGTVIGTSSDPLTYSTQGSFTIQWKFDDGNGNSTTATQNVIVHDTTAPVTPTLTNVTGQCSATATVPTTTDNCKGTITGTTTDPLIYTTQGTYIIHWKFDDGYGNSTTVNQNVIITVPAQPTGLSCWQTATFSPTTCKWVVSGTQPAKPTGLACWQKATFTTSCIWVITGAQPAQPTGLACWQTATFNTSKCQWVVTGKQPVKPRGNYIFDTTLCIWVPTGTQSSTSKFADKEADGSNSLDLNSYTDDKLLVYPNPVNDILTITNTKLISSIEVFNILGQHILLSRPNARTAEMDMSNLPAGIYLVQIQSEGKTRTVKVNKRF